MDGDDGTILAEATGRYVAAGDARKRELRAAYGFRVLPVEADIPDNVDPLEAARRRLVSPASPVTERAVAFVEARKAEAEALGTDLAELTQDPDAFAAALRRGLVALADPEYLEGQQRVAPGIGPVHGVRWPLMAAVARGFRQATKGDPATPLLFVADRLFREPELEPRWFAFGLLERTLTAETERTWQLLRRAAREAGDWITVDSLAHPYGKGIAAEPYRWAELEQLVYSPSRWERRLIGSTIATMTHVDRRRGRDPEVAAHALPLLAQLMGDAEPDVQKALSWAYRSLTVVDMPGTVAALRARDRPRRAHRRRAPGVGHPRHARQARSRRGRRPANPAGRDPPACRRAIHLRGRRGRDAVRRAAGSHHPPRTPARLTVARHRSSRHVTDDLGDIRAIRIEDEMRVSYLDYAMSVIVSRALPDVRDGLKPVHRRDPLRDGRDGPVRRRARTASARRSSAR